MQRTNALLAAVLGAFALAAPAHAASRFVINGAGFGHGVGMSQYGAYGYALHGKDYRFILAHYYSGTSLGAAPSGAVVRVLLQTSRRVSFTGASGAGGRRLRPTSTYSATSTGLGRVALRSASGRVIQTFDTPPRVTGPGPLTLLGSAQNGVRDGLYRGDLLLEATPVGTVNAVDAVGLEDYVRGVVGGESPSSWPAAALQAQAVAARTYAITTGGGPNFDQYADTRSQMYLGVAAETTSTDSAVRTTAGQVVTYQGRPAVTYFFSTSGGRTEDVQYSFIGSAPKPWLVSVDDPYDDVSPKHRWGPIRMTLAQAAAKLRGLVQGSFRGIDVTERGASPRVVYADVVGSRGRTRVTGPTLRARFGLDDTWATFSVITSSGTAQPVPGSGSDGGDSTSGGAGAAPGTDPTSGGVSPSGGSGPDGAAAARAAAYGQVGGVAGSVGIVHRPSVVRLQIRAGGHWHDLTWTRSDRHGRYRFGGLHHGAYRVAWHGATGPVVRV
jgi:stage II sporulation protein D